MCSWLAAKISCNPGPVGFCFKQKVIYVVESLGKRSNMEAYINLEPHLQMLCFLNCYAIHVARTVRAAREQLEKTRFQARIR